ncbi:NIPSNAP family containing protein [Rudanella paleaurantiibacter]|uniref:NIPSNAP family containing protein n=1 Tax=Rudanella paleaurantiibacter TaxID=2614655 RepID=A0A7J5U1V8_9BACT|nr:NIPSNAP family protein [Rudanella paleaurantiibacter]KAB7731789.1 NIPSNAP family containing protein [Rudanella paleaurantiibacter]
MKRRQFVASSLLAVPALSEAQAAKPAAQKEMYEFRTYQLRGGGAVSVFDKYLREALIPALNRQGVKTVGVFREMGKTEPPKVYVLIPHASAEAFGASGAKLAADTAYQQASNEYQTMAPDKFPVVRYSSSILSAFDALPQMIVPGKSDRIFELRTYEGYSEDAVRRKVKMFNVDELPIFYNVKLNPVFFGEIVAGEHMPALTYMLVFKDMAERDANWKQFSANADWKRVSQDPQYANTVSNIIRVFLEPVAYSQI